MNRLRITIATAALFWLGGCSKKTAAVKQPTASIPAASIAGSPRPEPQKSATSPSLEISDVVARGCQLRISSRSEAPRFGYDDVELQPADREVLEQIAVCLTKGPLRGKQVQLIGRADPRGTEEYNLALGNRRARSVSAFLERLGVPGAQLASTTRGDIDAAGTDETTWQQDRRVDLELQP